MRLIRRRLNGAPGGDGAALRKRLDDRHDRIIAWSGTSTRPPCRGEGSDRGRAQGACRAEHVEEPEDSGDEANELEQAGTDGALVEDLKRNLEEIGRAEQRLEDGSYGKSVVSGDPIPDERLEAIPWADRNVGEEPGGRG